MRRNLPKHVPTTEPFSPEIVCGRLRQWLHGVGRCSILSVGLRESCLTVGNRFQRISHGLSHIIECINLVESLPGTAPLRYIFCASAFADFLQWSVHMFCTCFGVSFAYLKLYHHISEEYFFGGAKGQSRTRPKNNLTCCKSEAETGICSRSTGRRIIVLQIFCLPFACYIYI